MNQILYINSEKKKGEPLEIKTILKIFAITLIIFGSILVIKTVFSMINNNNSTSQTIPLVEITNQGEKLLLKVNHDKLIDKIVYRWNNSSQEIVLQGKGRMQIQEEIELPIGINTLTLKVTDIQGKVASYSQVYERKQGDVIKPEIELLIEGSKVKIVAKDETELSYISYYWNNEDETRINVNENSLKQIEEKISILKGENTLTIVAVDKAGNENVKEQVFKAATKPVVEVSIVNGAYSIRVTDEEGISRVDYTYNGAEYSTDPNKTGIPLNVKEVIITQKLTSGENKIDIRAYNVSELLTQVQKEDTI